MGCLPTHLSIKLASCLSIWQTVSLADCLSIHLSISLEGHISIPSVCPPVSLARCLSTHLFVPGCMSFTCQSAGCLSICLSISLMMDCLPSHLSISLTDCPTICQFSGLSIHLPISLVGSLPIHLSINLAECLSIYLSGGLSIHLSISLAGHLSIHRLTVHPSIHQAGCLSNCMAYSVPGSLCHCPSKSLVTWKGPSCGGAL